MPDDPTPADNAIDRAAAALGEHFDSVLILATRTERGQTWMTNKGRGNWYAQMGSAREWIARQDALTRQNAVETSRPRDEDD